MGLMIPFRPQGYHSDSLGVKKKSFSSQLCGIVEHGVLHLVWGMPSGQVPALPLHYLVIDENRTQYL